MVLPWIAGAPSVVAPSAVAVAGRRFRSFWRYPDVSAQAAWPNYKATLTHRKHRFPVHTYGAQKQTRLRCVDNSKIGRQAMAEGKPPYVIHVYSKYIHHDDNNNQIRSIAKN